MKTRIFLLNQYATYMEENIFETKQAWIIGGGTGEVTFMIDVVSKRHESADLSAHLVVQSFAMKSNKW